MVGMVLTVGQVNFSICSWGRYQGLPLLRYRLTLSDGLYSSSFTVLAARLNSMVHMNQLTLLSIIGLVVTLLDYLGPILIDKIFCSTQWTGEKEKKLDNVCKSVVNTTFFVSSCWTSLSNLKTTSPITHFGVTTTSLLLLAYIGSLVSGMFLSYILTMLVLMLPGLYR